MSSEAETVIVAGKPLLCHHCGASSFHSRAVVMPGPVASALNFAAFAPRATCYVCSVCTFIHWFADEGGDPRRRPA